MRLFAVFEEIRASVKEECFNREDFFAGQVFEFGAQIDDARLVRLKLVIGEEPKATGAAMRPTSPSISITA
jgi:hypothetical protein